MPDVNVYWDGFLSGIAAGAILGVSTIVFVVGVSIFFMQWMDKRIDAEKARS